MLFESYSLTSSCLLPSSHRTSLCVYRAANEEIYSSTTRSEHYSFPGNMYLIHRPATRISASRRQSSRTATGVNEGGISKSRRRHRGSRAAMDANESGISKLCENG